MDKNDTVQYLEVLCEAMDKSGATQVLDLVIGSSEDEEEEEEEDGDSRVNDGAEDDIWLNSISALIPDLGVGIYLDGIDRV